MDPFTAAALPVALLPPVQCSFCSLFVRALSGCPPFSVELYGEFNLRCAVVYRSYGDALLQLYQKNSSVLGEIITADESKLKKLGAKMGGGGGEAGGNDEETDGADEQPAGQ
jgi:hypothetical protein